MDFNILKNALIKAAEDAGIKQYEIYYMETADASVSTFQHELKEVSSDRSGGICFRCIVNGKMGYASTELLEAEEMAELVNRAATAAAMIENNDEVFIFAGSPSYRDPVPAPEMTEMTALTKSALSLAEAAYAASPLTCDGTQAMASTRECEIHLVNSTGLDLSNRIASTGAGVQVIVSRDDEKQVAFNHADSLDADELAEMAKKTSEEACAKLGASEVATGKYNVVFSDKQTRSILSTFSSVFSSKNAQLGLSLLAGKEGETVAAPCVTISDDPARPGVRSQTHFDAEGVANTRKNIIENGVLKTLLYNLSTAAKAGVETTGNASKGGYSAPVGISPYCFCLEAGTVSLDDLFAQAGDGIYVTEMKGFHAGADAVTGDFSIECAGFRIQDGKLGGPLKSFTVAGNFFSWLKEISAVANNLDSGSPVCSPASALLLYLFRK
ncbi:MAG: TldD/PmbA family protein [Clostridia bacterium]|nr:TldD/PmbA family protein [Clostridia bacterium]